MNAKRRLIRDRLVRKGRGKGEEKRERAKKAVRNGRQVDLIYAKPRCSLNWLTFLDGSCDGGMDPGQTALAPLDDDAAALACSSSLHLLPAPRGL